MKTDRTRAEFVFTIGYDGARALVDGQGMKRYGRLSTQELAARGLFRAAWASALYSGDEAEKALVREAWIAGTGTDTASFDRLFGVALRDPATLPGKSRRPLILQG